MIAPGTTLLGKYKIDRLLGEGGMGAVYAAENTAIGRRVAVKLLHPEVASDARVAGRFRREARAAARIGHRNIVDVLDLAETEEGNLVLVMELLEGESLASRLSRGPIPIGQAIAIAIDVLEALDAAHRTGLVHRDIKPQNIFLVSSGSETQAKILDFGIAKSFADDTADITRSGAAIGTPRYMAPEQAIGSTVDARTDLWAVGAVLFEMVSGRRPYEERPGVLAQVLEAAPPSARRVSGEVSVDLDQVIGRALARHPRDRFENAVEMIGHLRRASSAYGVTLRDSSGAVWSGTALAPTERESTVARHRWKWIALLVGVGLVVLASVTVVVVASWKDDETPARAASSTSSAPIPPLSDHEMIEGHTAPVIRTQAPTVVRTVTARPSAQPSAPTLACPAGQIADKGHCCDIGFVWLTDRCARPLSH